MLCGNENYTRDLEREVRDAHEALEGVRQILLNIAYEQDLLIGNMRCPKDFLEFAKKYNQEKTLIGMSQ